MNSIFDTLKREEIIQRINSLTPSINVLWGKMNPFQIAQHCTRCEEMMQGDVRIKRVFIGRLIGKMILNKVLKDEKPFGKNSPTSPLLKTLDAEGDIDQQKKKWIEKIRRYENFKDPKLIHPFFGSMTREQIGYFAYKHADHHLRQMGL